jgi:hypothetical protein
VAFKEKYLSRARIFLVERRLYQVAVVGTKEKANSKEAETFLDSFKLTTE